MMANNLRLLAIVRWIKRWINRFVLVTVGLAYAHHCSSKINTRSAVVVTWFFTFGTSQRKIRRKVEVTTTADLVLILDEQ